MAKKKNKNDAHVLQLLGVIILFGIFLFLFWKYAQRKIQEDFPSYAVSSANSQPSSQNNSQITHSDSNALGAIQFDFGNGKRRRFEGPIAAGMTFADMVEAAAAVGKLDVTWQKGYIIDVNGVKNSGKHWRVYKNGQNVSINLPKMSINQKDEVYVKYE